MKLSDYVVKFVENITDSVFLLPGGGIMHLVDSIGRTKKINTYCVPHEQQAATAAEGYARVKNDIGVVFVTTGPGCTNAITGVAGSWLDSIPILVINGQVKTDNITPKKNGALVVRAIGVQEINALDLVRPISKYAETVWHPEDIRYHLEKAVYLAKSGRPGPSWVEIPLDIQAAQINPKKLRGYSPTLDLQTMYPKPKIPIDLIVQVLKKAKRPLFYAGNGIRLAGGYKIFQKLIKKLKINVVTPIFIGDDLATYDYPYYLGRQGMSGNETANWAVDNCDLLLVVGDRLQLYHSSYDYQNFASQATKIMVDIDENEIHKKIMDIDIPVHCDAKLFLEELAKQDIKLHRWNVPVKPIKIDNYRPKNNFLNVYKFLAELDKFMDDQHVATGDGMASLSTHQALKIHDGQRFITNTGLGQMGSGLPLAVGVCIASGKKSVICMEGDGSLFLNIQALQIVYHHKLPIKLFIWNNGGYYSIRSTHLNYFNREFASDPKTGVSFPNFEKLMTAWGFHYFKISGDKELYKIREVMNFKGPVVCELVIERMQPLLPRWMAGQYREI